MGMALDAGLHRGSGRWAINPALISCLYRSNIALSARPSHTKLALQGRPVASGHKARLPKSFRRNQNRRTEPCRYPDFYASAA